MVPTVQCCLARIIWYQWRNVCTRWLNNYYRYYPLCWSISLLFALGYLGLTFSWCCHGDVFSQIISANVSTANHQPVPLDDVELPFDVHFTYSVLWSSTQWVKLWSSMLFVLGPMRPCDVHVIVNLRFNWLFWHGLCNQDSSILYLCFSSCSTPYSERLKTKGAGTFFPKTLEVNFLSPSLLHVL